MAFAGRPQAGNGFSTRRRPPVQVNRGEMGRDRFGNTIGLGSAGAVTTAWEFPTATKRPSASCTSG